MKTVNHLGCVMGESHPKAKLTEKQVLEIKRRYLPFAVTAKQLSKEYGVSKATIIDITSGRTWGWLQ